MDKELDPLRELDKGAKKEESTPTVELSAEEKRRASETLEAEKPSPSKAAATRGNAPTPLRQPTIQTTSSHTRLRYGGHAVSIRENIAPREHIRLYGNIAPTLTLFTLGIIVAVLGIGVYKGMTTPVTATVFVGGATVPVNVIDPAAFPEAAAYVDPLFGAFAVKRCTERCEVQSSPTREHCHRGCSMYQLNMYGRRISFDKYDPYADASEVINRCTKREFALEMHTSGSVWSQDVVAAVELLNEGAEALRTADVARFRSYYQRLLQSNQFIRLPPGGTPAEMALTKDITQATCLTANLALTAVALGGAQQAADEVSARYYRDLYQGLESKTFDANARVLTQAKSLKLR